MKSRTLNQRPPEFRLDNGHPLARGLVFAGLAPPNLVGGKHYHDSSAFGIHSQATSTWEWISELGRYSLLGDSTQPLVNVGEHPAHFSTTFTVAAWTKLTASTGDYEAVIGRGTTTDTRQTYLLDISPWLLPRVYFRGGGSWYGVDGTLGQEVVVNSWTHLAATYDLTTLRLFSSGNQLGTLATTAAADANGELLIGGWGTGYAYYFTGNITDALIWNYALPQTLLRQLADPSNVMLSGLILPPRRKLFRMPAAGGGSTSASASQSASPSASASTSASGSPSASASASVSQSFSPSTSASASASQSASASASRSGSSSVSESFSASHSASASASTSASSSESGGSGSASHSASRSASTSASRSASPSASLSQSASISQSLSASSSESSSESSEDTTLLLTVEMVRSDTLERIGQEATLTVGGNQQRQRMRVSTTEIEIAIEPSGVVGLCYVWHDDTDTTAHYLDIGYSTGTYPHRLLPGESGLIPLATTTGSLFLVSDASTYFEYEIHQRSISIVGD
jgi:hypothetical protein